jgi:hypothetical protein
MSAAVPQKRVGTGVQSKTTPPMTGVHREGMPEMLHWDSSLENWHGWPAVATPDVHRHLRPAGFKNRCGGFFMRVLAHQGYTSR